MTLLLGLPRNTLHIVFFSFREISFPWKSNPELSYLRRSHRSVQYCICIMPWSASQQTRLGYEKQLLEQYFHGNRTTWIDPAGNTRVEIRVTCSSNREYTLRIYIPVDFPNSCPQMVVCNPSHCLVKCDGTAMNFADNDDHTWGSKDGCTQICHYKPAE